MTEIVSWRRILIRLAVQDSEFVSVFIEAIKISVFNIFLNRPIKKGKTTVACCAAYIRMGGMRIEKEQVCI
jgi:hypothetical protein